MRRHAVARARVRPPVRLAPTFLPDLVATVVAAHLLAARRPPLAAPRSWSPSRSLAAGSVLVISWIYLPAHHAAGGSPRGRTSELARSQLSDAFSPFRKLIAPVPITAGFELTMALVVWVLAVFADAAAFRGEAPVQAIVPHVGRVLRHVRVRPRARGVARRRRDAFAAAVVSIVAAPARVAGVASDAGSRTSVGAGPMWSIGVGAVARGHGGSVAAVVVGPRSPGRRYRARWSTSRSIGRGPGPRRGRQPAGRACRTCSAPSPTRSCSPSSRATPHYWRLTALEEFDGADQQWKTDRRYDETDVRRAPGPDPSCSAPTSTRSSPRSTSPTSAGSGCPRRSSPIRSTADIDVRYDPDVVEPDRRRRTSPAADVATTWCGPDPRRSARTGGTPAGPDPTGRPACTSTSRRSAQVVDSTRERHRRGGERLVDVRPGARAAGLLPRRLHLPTPTSTTRPAADPTCRVPRPHSEGFCQQFASTFALMARSLGHPVARRRRLHLRRRRPSADRPGTATTGTGPTAAFVVRGRHAHAWPELYIAGAGWLPFEPTPSRGNPDATQYTGVAAAQARAPGTPGRRHHDHHRADRAAAPSRPRSADEIQIDEDRPSAQQRRRHERRRSSVDLWPVLPWILIGLGAGLRHRPDRVDGPCVAGGAAAVATRPTHRVRAAWVESCDWLEMLALRPPAERDPGGVRDPGRAVAARGDSPSWPPRDLRLFGPDDSTGRGRDRRGASPRCAPRWSSRSTAAALAHAVGWSAATDHRPTRRPTDRPIRRSVRETRLVRQRWRSGPDVALGHSSSSRRKRPWPARGVVEVVADARRRGGSGHLLRCRPGRGGAGCARGARPRSSISAEADDEREDEVHREQHDGEPPGRRSRRATPQRTPRSDSE